MQISFWTLQLQRWKLIGGRRRSDSHRNAIIMSCGDSCRIVVYDIISYAYYTDNGTSGFSVKFSTSANYDFFQLKLCSLLS